MSDLIYDLAHKSLSPKLSNRENRFVRAYDGDLVYALRVAGYHGSDLALKAKGKELLQRPDLQQAIMKFQEKNKQKEGALLSKVDKMEFLASIVRNSDPYERATIDDYGQEVQPDPPTMAERLKALDMYNKMEGEYHTNINVNHNLSMSELILSSFVDNNRKLEDIEADYLELKSGESEEYHEPDDLLGL